MDTNNESDVVALAIRLLVESGYNNLTIEQSWRKEQLLSPVELSKLNASNYLFTLAEDLKQARLRTEADAAIKRGIELNSIPIPE